MKIFNDESFVIYGNYEEQCAYANKTHDLISTRKFTLWDYSK